MKTRNTYVLPTNPEKVCNCNVCRLEFPKLPFRMFFIKVNVYMYTKIQFKPEIQQEIALNMSHFQVKYSVTLMMMMKDI